MNKSHKSKKTKIEVNNEKEAFNFINTLFFNNACWM